MDDRTDSAFYSIEKKFGPAECDCEGTCALAYRIGDNIHHYRDSWEKISDQHFPGCPVSIAADRKQISTLCLCSEIEQAEKWAEDDEIRNARGSNGRDGER